jgi:hypothetical protein
LNALKLVVRISEGFIVINQTCDDNWKAVGDALQSIRVQQYKAQIVSYLVPIKLKP